MELAGMIYDDDADLTRNLLDGATIAVLGFGNQGHAHALNLRDRKARVVVGARRAGTAWNAAVRDGFEPREIARAVENADAVVVLLPDEVQGEAFAREIEPALKDGAVLVFAHGFAIAFGLVKPPRHHDVVLVAPKGQGHFLRQTFLDGTGLPCLIAVESDVSGSARAKALSYAHLIGCLDAGAIETTFREEAVTDLFGEQAVLCGGVPELVKAAFETLVHRGYAPEIAYLECLHELKIISDLMYEKGISGMRYSISNTAEYGDLTRGKRVIGEPTREAMKKILDEIQSGEFAKEWIAENRARPRELPSACGRSRRTTRSRRSATSCGRRWTGSTRSSDRGAVRGRGAGHRPQLRARAAVGHRPRPDGLDQSRRRGGLPPARADLGRRGARERRGPGLVQRHLRRRIVRLTETVLDPGDRLQVGQTVMELRVSESAGDPENLPATKVPLPELGDPPDEF